MKKERKFKIFKLVCLICYILCAVVLIVESCMDSGNSSAHSLAVGGTIAGIINDFKGDQTVAVSPTSLKINNKIDEGYVGKTHILETETLPTEATYKQITFTSSNSNIAKIDETGLITFLLPGDVTITATNTRYPEIYDSFDINVKNIEIASVTNKINAEQDSNGIYTLYFDIDVNDSDYVSYYIDTNVDPLDATHQKITYAIDKKDYISVDDNGKITPLKYSANNVTTITINVEGYEYKEEETKELKVIVGLKSIKPVESVSVENESYEIYVTQRLTPKVTINPSDATFKDYKLTSSSDCVSISGTSVVGKKDGTATIDLVMKDYPSIKTSFEVEVYNQPEVTDFNVNESISIIEGKTSKITISGVKPAYGNISGATFESSDSNIASVNKNGIITAKCVGTATITTTITTTEGVISKTTRVNVSLMIDDVDEIELVGEINPIVIKGKEYNLNEFANNICFIKDEINIDPIQKNFSYSLEDGTIIGKTFTPSSLGEVEIIIEHQSSGANTSITLLVIDKFNVAIGEKTKSFNQNDDEIYELNVNESIPIFINQDEESEQEYEVVSSKPETTLITNKDNGEYSVLGVSNGEPIISVYPKVNTENNDLINSVKEQYTYSIELNISHVYSESIDFRIHDNKNNKDIEISDSDNTLMMFINDDFSLIPVLDVRATIYSLKIISLDETILKIDNDYKLNPRKIGEVDVIVKEEHSNKEKTIHVMIFNKILINQEQPIVVSGHEATYNKSSKRYEITNGYSGKIELSFLEESTYKKVQYQSSDESILEVDQNGVLTPHKKGNVTITLTVDDGMIDKTVINIDIRVKPQRVIENMQEFFGKVRKAVGHYGAFLVLGIFSTLTYLLYFSKKHWLWSVPLNFAQGFGLAVLTEYIQLYVPGRHGCWSDILLDTSGFMLSALLITLIILINSLVKYILMKKRNK